MALASKSKLEIDGRWLAGSGNLGDNNLNNNNGSNNAGASNQGNFNVGEQKPDTQGCLGVMLCCTFLKTNELHVH